MSGNHTGPLLSLSEMSMAWKRRPLGRGGGVVCRHDTETRTLYTVGVSIKYAIVHGRDER